ncbi:MAG: AMP-binding protein [Pseudomonadota bacterium]
MTDSLYAALFGPHEGSETVFLDLGDGNTVSHAAFLELAARQAGALRAAGVVPGDRVAVQVSKSPEALAIYAACCKLGAVLLPLNTSYMPNEIGYFLSDAKPAVLICDPGAAEALAPLARATGAQVLTLDASASGSYADAWATAEPVTVPEPRAPEDLAAILYTSGTTGRSKGAMLTNANLLSNAKTLTAIWQFTDSDVLIHVLPIFHTHGLFVAVNVALISGCRLRFMPGFDLDAVVDALPSSTALMGVPTVYKRLLSDVRLTKDLVSSMRLFVSGSAPLLADTHEDFEARTGHRILERYGMTETNMNTSNPYDGARKAGTVGQPLPGVEVRVTDPATGDPMAQGARGMVEVRGPNVFKGYWNMPEKTAEELRPSGFFITGDLGEIGADGYLTIVGRAKDLIISGGYNIYPKEIELVLDDQPGVLESAVVGVPHPDMGEGESSPHPGDNLSGRGIGV